MNKGTDLSKTRVAVALVAAGIALGVGAATSDDPTGADAGVVRQAVTYDEWTRLDDSFYEREGHTFVAWNTRADGSGENCEDGAVAFSRAEVQSGESDLYAQWSANSYLITFNANGGTGGWKKVMTYGDVLSAPEVSRTGFTFLRWSPEVPRTVPAAPYVFTAIWAANVYTITFDANGGTGGWSMPMAYDSEIDPPVPYRSGYKFKGWSPAVPARVGTSDATYVAQWEKESGSEPAPEPEPGPAPTPASYVITFNANGGTGGWQKTMTHGDVLSAPEVSRTGFTFLRWSPEVPRTVPAAPYVFTAIWAANVYTITFDANGGTGGWSKPMAYDSELDPPVPYKLGHKFMGWLPAVPAYTRVGTSDATYVAQWKKNSYEIGFNANGGTGGRRETMTYGDALSAPTVSRTGFTFLRWSPEVPRTVPAAPYVYTAIWTANVYTITFDANGGTGGWSKSMAYDSELDPPVPYKAGYKFKGWSPTVPARVGTSDATYVAQWEETSGSEPDPGPAPTPASYVITFNANGGTGGWTNTLVCGTPLSAPEVERTGFTFLYWQPTVPRTVPAAPYVYTANWAANVYTITFDANGGTGGWSASKFYNSELDPPVPYRSGYKFKGWLPELPAYTRVGPSNATYVAQWEKLSDSVTPDPEPSPSPAVYVIVFDANGGTGGWTNALASGTPLVVPAVERTGFKFLCWSPEVPANVGSSSATYVAQWEEISDPVTPDPVTPDPVTPDPVIPDPVTPDPVAPDPAEGEDVTVYGGEVQNLLFSKAQTATGALYDGEDVFVGVVELKFGKINQKKGTVKVSASLTAIDGGKSKKISATAVTLQLVDGMMAGILSFKNPIGKLTFEMDEDGAFTLSGNGYEMRAAAIGAAGALSNGNHTFYLDGFDLAVPGELQEDLLPDGEAFTVSGKKWTFAKNTTVKVAKNKVTKEYDLEVDDTKGKTNHSSLKLTYTANTGLFKGSFKVYAVEEANGGKKKLKKYTVNVIGFVVDGEGAGQASISKPNGGPWAVSLE